MGGARQSTGEHMTTYKHMDLNTSTWPAITSHVLTQKRNVHTVNGNTHKPRVYIKHDNRNAQS